ncbi:MAG TPA: heparinase II/III family protein [Gemmatimonadales bacterium]|nr:heparinase II/III family protein [Gemmatimonadales bacterium]
MVTAERLAERRELVGAAPDLRALTAHIARRNTRVVQQLPPIPEVKALLSVDGGRCPADGATLRFDPWSPDAHTCPVCHTRHSGVRHHRAWARLQHLWLAERAVELAALAALGDGGEPAARRSAEILRGYGDRYFQYPNRDNVLGPSRLFFSTYLESIWILNYLSAAMLLRETEWFDDATRRAVTTVGDEAANLIGDFDEGFSNRQTWNNAALCAIAVWFEDEDLATRAIQGQTGLIAHLRGYREDGLWYEGENYHLFALRGLITGTTWAGEAGVDFYGEPELAEGLTRALSAPALTALPDLTFPARKDSRFGISLAQPMYLDTWEVGLGRLVRGSAESASDLPAWLAALYAAGPVSEEVFESYLHDAPVDQAPTTHSRQQLSWWSLLEMLPELPASEATWTPPSVYLEGQGLAVLRSGGRYASLECGATGGGHGHPDRLNLTLHGDGVYWLPDFGTGSYVARELFWYRSTLAHNAPRLDGKTQPFDDATIEGYEAGPEWGWARGRFGDVTRTVVMGAQYLLDVVELTGRDERLLELPWHFAGRGEIEGGRWVDGILDDEFVDRVAQLASDASSPIALELTDQNQLLTTHFVFSGELLRAEGPGRPGGTGREPFYLQRVRARNARFVTVLEYGKRGTAVLGVRLSGDLMEIKTPAGNDRHRFAGTQWTIEQQGKTIGLETVRAPQRVVQGLDLDPDSRATATALRVAQPPRLDGTLDGFDTTEPLLLELEDQYRRSEEAYTGPEDFAARVFANWDDDALYLAVQVHKQDPVFRGPDAPPLQLDNEPDDIHSDGVQVYLSDSTAPRADIPQWGYLVVPVPDNSSVRTHVVSDATGDARDVRGAWRTTSDGYCVTLAVQWPEGLLTHVGGRVGFDVIVNEMAPGRERRVGQLVWSGGGGWVFLRGDRQDVGRHGMLELVG